MIYYGIHRLEAPIMMAMQAYMIIALFLIGYSFVKKTPWKETRAELIISFIVLFILGAYFKFLTLF